jgi:ribosomal 50S subunit-associated protein YjgA (DUF615 family)
MRRHIDDLEGSNFPSEDLEVLRATVREAELEAERGDPDADVKELMARILLAEGEDYIEEERRRDKLRA